MSEVSNMHLESEITMKLAYVTALAQLLCENLGNNTEAQEEATFAYLLREQIDTLRELKEVAVKQLD